MLFFFMVGSVITYAPAYLPIRINAFLGLVAAVIIAGIIIGGDRTDECVPTIAGDRMAAYYEALTGKWIKVIGFVLILGIIGVLPAWISKRKNWL